MDVAEGADQRRRVLDVGQQRRVAGLAPGDEPGADAVERFHFLLGVGLGADPEPVCPATVTGQPGQGIERRPGAAETLQQFVERDRADVVGPGQTQPVQLFVGGQGLGVGFVHGHGQPKKFLLCSITGDSCCARGKGGKRGNEPPRLPPVSKDLPLALYSARVRLSIQAGTRVAMKTR